jgi:nucleoside-diphosphate-sugar epimerase
LVLELGPPLTILSGLSKRSLTCINLHVQVIHHEGRRSDVPQIILDITRARQELCWSPRISLNDGLGRA